MWRIKIEQLDSHAHFKIYKDGCECHPDEESRCVMRLRDFVDFVKRLEAEPITEEARWIHPYGEGAEEIKEWLGE